MWTLSGPASGTLGNLAVEGAAVEFTGQAADSCSLTFRDPDHAAAFYAAGANTTLSRDGTAYFRGRVSLDSRSGNPARDTRSVMLLGAWDDLDRLPYAQSWTHWGGSSVETQDDHARLIVGRSVDGPYTDTAAALGDVLTYAAAHGVAIQTGDLPTTKLVPLIETHGRTCGDILRQILRYHPEAGVWIDHSTSPPTFNAVDPVDLANITIDGSGHPLSDFTLANYSHESPTNVIIRYECLVEDLAYDGNASGNHSVRYRRTIYTDSAGGTSIVPGTLLVAMPAVFPDQPVASPKEQKITSTAIPDYDATNDAAKRFWKRHSPLDRLEIAIASIQLPGSTSGDIKSHGKMAVPLPDEDDLEEDEEIPSFWTDTLSLLSRELRSGMIHDWMSRSFGFVRCRCTIAIDKTVVDALAAEDKAEMIRLCRPETVSSATFPSLAFADAYLLDQEVTIAATNALSRTYYENVVIEGTLPDLANQTIPGLAQTYYDMATAPRWKGTILLTEAEAGAANYQGAVINIAHAERPEWATMNARVQSISVDIPTGRTRLSVGTPDHLSLQDLAALKQIARTPLARHEIRVAGTIDPDDPLAPAWTDGKAGKQTGAAFGPSAVPSTIGSNGAIRRWQVTANSTHITMAGSAGRVHLAGNSTAAGVTVGNATSGLLAVGSVGNGTAVWLQASSKALAGLTLVAGSLPSALYEESGGNITKVVKILGDFSDTNPGAGSSLISLGGNTTKYWRERVPDGDITAYEATVFVNGNATHGVILLP